MTQQTEKPVCKTCNGERMVGGWSGGAASIDGGGSYENWPCPDCTTPTYDQLSALCAQMAAAMEIALSRFAHPDIRSALTAYRTLSPDPQWQRVPEGCVVVPLEPTQDMLDACGPKPPKWDSRPESKMLREECDKMRREDYIAMVNRARGEG